MKYWIRLFALISCIILIFAVIGMLLPHGYSLQATRTINAAPSEVYQQIDSLPKWKTWSQWNPDTVESLTIEYGADGKSQRWTDIRGDGKLWFTDQQQNERVDYQLRFANFPEMTSSITLQPDGESNEKTLVTWTSEGTLPASPFYGFFRHIFVDGMTVEYEHSLTRLQNVVEGTGDGASGDEASGDESSGDETSSNETEQPINAEPALEK